MCWKRPKKITNKIVPMNLMLPSILRLAKYFASSSSVLRPPFPAAIFSYCCEIWARFSNSSRHFLSNNFLKVHAVESDGSKLGAFSTRNLHNCAYIDEYFGSSRAFSKIYQKRKKCWFDEKSNNRKIRIILPKQSHPLRWWMNQDRHSGHHW